MSQKGTEHLVDCANWTLCHMSSLQVTLLLPHCPSFELSVFELLVIVIDAFFGEFKHAGHGHDTLSLNLNNILLLKDKNRQ